MFTSDTDGNSRIAGKTALNYLVAAALCALFAAVYEYFSHGVYSGFMVFAFLIPLLGGAGLFWALRLFRLKRFPGFACRMVYHCAVATLTVGSIVRGVLEIYGTTSVLLVVYSLAGFGLLVLSFWLYLAENLWKK